MLIVVFCFQFQNNTVKLETNNHDLQVPGVYWWYKTASHAAELTAGYYNPSNQDGYSSVFEVLKKHAVTMKFVCAVPSLQDHEALADPEGLSWQVMVSFCYP